MFVLILEDVLRRIASLEGDFKNLRDKVSSNEKLVSNHDIAINDILKELARIRKRKSSTNNASGVNPEQFTALLDDLINKLRQEIMKMLEEMNKKLDKKIEMEDLWKSEGFVL